VFEPGTQELFVENKFCQMLRLMLLMHLGCHEVSRTVANRILQFTCSPKQDRHGIRQNKFIQDHLITEQLMCYHPRMNSVDKVMLDQAFEDIVMKNAVLQRHTMVDKTQAITVCV